MNRAALSLTAVLLTACASAAPDRTTPREGAPPSTSPALAASASASSSPGPPRSASSAPSPAPHEALFKSEPRVRQLPLPDFQDVHLVLPRGDGSRPARLAVVAHGAGERPEPHCDHYAKLLGEGTLVACTRGFPQNRHLPEPQRGYFYDGHHRLGAELKALLAALASQAPYAGNVSTTGALYAGFSQGATMGLLALHEDPDLAAHFDAILLIDGGAGEWTVSLAERMAARHTRVAIVCGVPTCSEKVSHSRPWLERAGLDHRVRITGAGHRLDSRNGEAVAELLPWLLGAAE